MVEKSPWALYIQWLNNGNLKSELPEDVIKKINPRSILSSLCNHYDLTIFLNKYFNDFNTLFQTLDIKELCKFIKKIMIEKKFDTYSLKFLKHETTDKYKKDIQPKLPHLKVEEIRLLEKLCIGCPEEKHISEFLGLEKQKVEKNRKKTSTQKEKIIVDKEEKIIVDKEEKISWDIWSKNFSK